MTSEETRNPSLRPYSKSETLDSPLQRSPPQPSSLFPFSLLDMDHLGSSWSLESNPFGRASIVIPTSSEFPNLSLLFLAMEIATKAVRGNAPSLSDPYAQSNRHHH